MLLSAGRNTRPVTRRVILEVSSIYNKCITFPPANGMTLIRPFSIFRMFASIGVVSLDTRSVFSLDPDLFGGHRELVNIRQIHDPWEPGRNPAEGSVSYTHLRAHET